MNKCKCRTKILQGYRGCDRCMENDFANLCQIETCNYTTKSSGSGIICNHHWNKYRNRINVNSDFAGLSFDEWWRQINNL